MSSDVPFFSPKSIKYTNNSTTLSAIVIECKQLIAGIVGCAQSALQLVFVAKGLQLSTGHQELLSLVSHVICLQKIVENLEVLGLVYPFVFTNFVKVWITVPLASFV